MDAKHGHLQPLPTSTLLCLLARPLHRPLFAKPVAARRRDMLGLLKVEAAAILLF